MADYQKIGHFVAGRPIVDPQNGAPTTDFLRSLNTNLANIKATLGDLTGVQEQIVAALEQAGIALAAAEELQANLETQVNSLALINSYTDPTAILTAEVNGTSAKITIASHNRVYGDADETTVAVTGGVLTGLAFETTYFIYYNDADRDGGTVTYLATTVANNAVQGGIRHTVGAITTPASTATAPVEGGGTTGPGIPWWKDPRLD